MNDAHFSAYGFGSRSKSGWEPDASRQHAKKINDFMGREYRKIANNQIKEISKKDEEIGGILDRALSMSRRGIWPFQAIPIKREKALITQKIKEEYFHLYQYLVWEYDKFFQQKIEEVDSLDRVMGRMLKHANEFAQKGAKPFAFISPEYKRKQIEEKIRSKYPEIYRYLLKKYEVAR